MNHLASDYIPQTDSLAGYLAHKQEIDHAIDSVLQSGRYILGQCVTRFEHAFAEYLGVRGVIGVASGMDALFSSICDSN